MALPWETTSSSGGGSTAETFGPMQYDASIGKYIQLGSRGTVRVVADPAQTTSGQDPSGYDPSTGLPYGVTRVSTTVSPTGLVYQGIPVNPDGSRYSATSSTQVPGYSGIKEGTGGLWGLNDLTGRYELIPGSETLGKAPTSGAATYSGGGGYQIPRDYVGEAKAKGEAGVAVAQAEGAAQQGVVAARTAGEMELLKARQSGDTEESALDRAFQAAIQAYQGSFTNRQLQQQDEAQKRAAANDFRSAVSDTDPIAFAALMKAWGGNAENAIRGGGTAVTDRALGGAAGLLDLIRRPFQGVPGFTWDEPTGSFVPNGTGAAGSGAVPGLGSGAGMPSPGGGTSGVGTANPALDGGIPESGVEKIFQQLQQLHSVGYDRPPTPEELALFRNIAEGRGGEPLITGNYSGLWQSVDPSAPNWRPPYEGYNLPGQTFNWATNQNEPTVVAPTTPVNQPLTVPGLASDAIPGMARGGPARGAFIVGDSPSGKPTGHEEMVIAPQGAHVIPLDKMQAGRMMRGGLRRYNTGTDWMSFYGWDPSQLEQLVNPQPTYTEPAPQPTTTTGGSGTTTVAYRGIAADTGPSSIGGTATYQRPVTETAPITPSQVRADTGPSSLGATNTTNTAAVPSTNTPPQVSAPAAPAPVPTTVSGLVNYGGQQITPDYQALLDEIRNFRTDPTQNVYDRTLNPMDVSFNNLDPISQEVFYKGRQAEFGIPMLAQMWEQNKFRLPGLSRGMIGIGY